MLIEMMTSKIHRVKVTEANLNYIGSITIDMDLLDAAGILEGQRVWIVNNASTHTRLPESGAAESCASTGRRRAKPSQET